MAARRNRKTVQQNSSEISDDEAVRLPSPSSGTNESIDRLADIMASFIKATEKKSAGGTTKGDVVPSFDPESLEQSAESWCKKVDELREVFGWSEDATIYFALAKLSGLAEVWYKGLRTIKFTWEEWKEKLQTAFPSKRDFYEALGEVMRRRKRPDESYAKYFYEMCGLLNACKISGVDAVSCVIGGIDDVIVKAGAKAGNHQTPESLFQYLSSLNGLAGPSGIQHRPPKYQHQKFRPHQSKYPYRRSHVNPTRSSKTVTCFRCGKIGHMSNACDQPEKRCTFCRRAGHYESECYNKKPNNQTKTVA